MLDAFVRSTSGLGLTGAACESTLPKIGSTTSFAWQHGHVTFRFSPSFSPMAVFYANFILTPAGALRMWLAEEICHHAAVVRSNAMRTVTKFPQYRNWPGIPTRP